MKFFIWPGNELTKDLGLLLMRVGIGLIFIRHGLPKIMAGKEDWLWLGGAMKNFGITFAPLFWGFLAACAESLGGIFLTIGFCTRAAVFFMACVMLVATVMHINKGDSWGHTSYPLSLLIVFLSIFISGAGRYSLDAFLW